MQIVVVGASLGGLRVVQGLRRQGFRGRLTLIGDETHLPYDRPPLSKQILTGSWESSQVWLTDHAEMHTLDVDLRLGTPAAHLDLGRREVQLADGSLVPFDRVVLATGATARRWGCGAHPAGLHHLRTLDDSLRIRAAMATARDVVVIGGGFIGAEVAAAARQRGLGVTLVMREPGPLHGPLGPEIGDVCADLHRSHGVRVIGDVDVTAVEGDVAVEAVLLSDGTRLPADVVILGMGAVPATGWLTTSGLQIDDGVRCDQFGAADDEGVVYAVGDVARWADHTGQPVRTEHWTSTVEQAHHAAHNMVADPDDRLAYRPVPYFWSDEYDVRIQMVGRHVPGVRVEVTYGALEQHRFAAAYLCGDELIGAVGFNAPRQIARYRKQLRENLDSQVVGPNP